MSKNVVETKGPQSTSQYGAYAFRAVLARLYSRMCMHMPTRLSTHAMRKHAHTDQYVTVIAFPQQQWSRKRASVLRYRLWYSASSFNFQNHRSLRSSISCLRLLHFPPVSSILPSICPSIMCFRRQFLCSVWPNQLFFLIFVVCRIFLSSMTFCSTSSFFTRSVHLIFSILQHHISNFLHISDLLAEMSMFQHHSILCSNCSTLLISSVNWNPVRL
jgi:hypothetical protein